MPVWTTTSPTSPPASWQPPQSCSAFRSVCGEANSVLGRRRPQRKSYARSGPVSRSWHTPGARTWRPASLSSPQQCPRTLQPQQPQPISRQTPPQWRQSLNNWPQHQPKLSLNTCLVLGCYPRSAPRPPLPSTTNLNTSQLWTSSLISTVLFLRLFSVPMILSTQSWSLKTFSFVIILLLNKLIK